MVLSRIISRRETSCINLISSVFSQFPRKTSISKIYARRVNYKVFYYRNAMRLDLPFAISRHTLEIFCIVKTLLGFEVRGR